MQPRFTLADLEKSDLGLNKPGATPPTLYPPHDYDTYEWAMVIDNASCIGCNACVVACQAENNVPIVGPDEIAVGRDMHWLRIDDYLVDGKPGFSPVPCMHCEHAPCEPVCPVAASLHDSEGLNLQVYNRCVGTRFCNRTARTKCAVSISSAMRTAKSTKALATRSSKPCSILNVTVRGRGVMEKCTYCVQRISKARRAAEKEHRKIREGEVVTACQAACPTRAITFGDLSDSNSRINDLRGQPQAYALLGDLGTRPRTTYLAHLQNPNPDFGSTCRDTAAITNERLPPDLTRWTLPAARSLEAVNEIVAAPLYARERWSWRAWWIGVAVSGALTVVFLVSIAMVLIRGIGIWGINTTVVWGFAIAEYVWWIGIGNAGTLISAMLAADAAEMAGRDQPLCRGDDAVRRGLSPEFFRSSISAGRCISIG